MYTTPTVYTCPFCPPPTGEVFVNADACLDQRIEDPDPISLCGTAVDGEQDMLRFGRGTDRRVPCRHMVFARGAVEWLGQGDDPAEEGDGPKWGFEFEWTAPCLRALDRGVGAMTIGDPELLAALGAERTPRVLLGYRRPAFSWDAMADSRTRSSVYRIDALFVTAGDPAALRPAVAGHVKAVLKAVRAKKAGGSG